MPNYTLTYFDFDGGRGEPIRIAFHAAGIAFEDNRLNFAQFGEMRQGLPFNSLPLLEIDGAAITQSNAICRYVGRMAGLYPADEMQALYCDEVLDAQEDLAHYIGPTFGLEGEELRLAREKLVSGWMTVYVRGLERLLVRGGGKYFADNALTMADLKTFVNTRWLRSGALDHVPTDLVQQLAPGLVEHQERVVNDPRVVAYYASRG
jgi:glutathione S-transferase